MNGEKGWGYRNYYQRKAHQEIDTIFLTLLPQQGLSVRNEQIRLCHEMLDALFSGKIALCMHIWLPAFLCGDMQQHCMVHIYAITALWSYQLPALHCRRQS